VLHPATFFDEKPIEELGRSYALISDGIRIKPYPCGGLTHHVIDSILEFRAKHGLTAEMVESVDVDVAKHTFERIVFKVPQTGIQGKFCMPYLVARALIDGKVSLHAFTEAAVRESQVLKLAERVQMNLGTDLKKTDPGGRPCRVTLRTKSGQTYIREAQHAKGSPEFPMTEAELKGKFTECAREALSADAADRALAQIEGLEKVDNIRSLAETLRG
jgi:2-methylcitrate dehydratase PrpD